MKIEVLLGGRTRFAVLEALAEAGQPATAYQIAMNKGLDPAATYRCLTEFAEVGIVEPEIKERNQTLYKLSKGSGKAAVEFLQSLKQKTSGPMDLEKWISTEIQAERMAKIVKININQFDTSARGKPVRGKDITALVSNRTPRELSALIASSQIAFRELFDEKDGTYILKA